jgi:dienelactone hydrolase
MINPLFLICFSVFAQADSLPQVLPGTREGIVPVSQEAFSRELLDGAHRFVDQKIKQAGIEREQEWIKGMVSNNQNDQLLKDKRKKLKEILGVASLAVTEPGIEVMANLSDPVAVAEMEHYAIFQIKWPVFGGLYGEGLLLKPKADPKGHIIAVPDADQLPEQLAGLAPGLPESSQFARHLAENGFEVIVPTLINREVLTKDQTAREWIYRQAFHMGKHLIGFEVQQLMAITQYWQNIGAENIGIAGFGEGGLIALITAALDVSVDASLVSGYFGHRQEKWEEPIYRNIWDFSSHFGDAELAAMIVPRGLVIEHSQLPEKTILPTQKPKDYDPFIYSGYKGSLKNADFNTVSAEFDRISLYNNRDGTNRKLLAGKQDKPAAFGSIDALNTLMQFMGVKEQIIPSEELPLDHRKAFRPEERQLRLRNGMEAYIQQIMHQSPRQRNKFYLHRVMPNWANKKWSTKSYHLFENPDHFIKENGKFRDYFRNQVIGSFSDELLPANPSSIGVYDHEKWRGYAISLDVFPEFGGGGILLVPKVMGENEQRPVVVVQHGRNGVPDIVIEGHTSYNDMAARLAEEGFVVFVPYGLFSGEDRYRWLDRKANTIGKTLFSFVLAQHEQYLKWLGSLPFVDNDRIAFYGKSYGGETAMRIPSILEGYCLSVCSADFGDWTRKVVDTSFKNSFMHTEEWEMPYFNMGNTFSYAEMAYLIFPRPFMVERGRHDLVQPDAWVAYEYEKVRSLYHQFNKIDQTTIEYFNGGHASRNKGVFDFLHQHLNWP